MDGHSATIWCIRQMLHSCYWGSIYLHCRHWFIYFILQIRSWPLHALASNSCYHFYRLSNFYFIFINPSIVFVRYSFYFYRLWFISDPLWSSDFVEEWWEIRSLYVSDPLNCLLIQMFAQFNFVSFFIY